MVKLFSKTRPMTITPPWKDVLEKRVLVTCATTRVGTHEVTLKEISPNGMFGKFTNNIADTTYWSRLNEWHIIDVLPDIKRHRRLC